jgi:branched-chain amino acid transport system substrate-binding protein
LTQQREKLFLEKAAASGLRLERLTELERLEFARATFSLRNDSILRWNREFSLNLPEPLSLSDSHPSEGVSSQNELVVGINADLSLGAATAGKSIVSGAEFAATEINAKGGLLGRPLRIEALDHGGINLRGIANLQKLEKTSGLIGVIGGIHSNVVLSELDFIHEEKIPYLIPWAAAVDIVDNGRSPNFVFRLGARDEYVARFLVGEAIRSTKKIALLLENTVWGRSCLQAMEKELLNVGLKPLTVQWVDRGAGEVNVQASAVDASGAEVVLMVLNSPEGALAVKTFAERRASIRILSHWGITSHNFFKDASDALKKITVEFFQPFSFSRIPQQRAKDILQYFEKTRGRVVLSQIQAPAGFAHAYDLVMILSEAVKKAGRIERQAIRNALEGLPEYRGLSRTFNPVFTPQRHEALDPSGYFLAKFDENGVIVEVEKK